MKPLDLRKKSRKPLVTSLILIVFFIITAPNSFAKADLNNFDIFDHEAELKKLKKDPEGGKTPNKKCPLDILIDKLELDNVVPGDRVFIQKGIIAIYDANHTISCYPQENKITLTGKKNQFTLPIAINNSCTILTIGSLNTKLPQNAHHGTKYQGKIQIFASYDSPCIRKSQ